MPPYTLVGDPPSILTYTEPVGPVTPVLPTAPVVPVAPVAPVEKETLERTTSQVAPFHFQMRLPTVCVSLTDGEFGKSIAGIVTP
jgi:hypothetical protein